MFPLPEPHLHLHLTNILPSHKSAQISLFGEPFRPLLLSITLENQLICPDCRPPPADRELHEGSNPVSPRLCPRQEPSTDPARSGCSTDMHRKWLEKDAPSYCIPALPFIRLFIRSQQLCIRRYCVPHMQEMLGTR